MIFTTDSNLFKREQESRLPSYFSANRAKLKGFKNAGQFVEWYMSQLELSQNRCHYCQTSILEIRSLLNAGLISGRSVKGNGLRGPNFEIDRRDPFGEYEESNCVLSCYYCNNDKSKTFSYDTYLKYFGPAKAKAFESLLKCL